MAEFQNVTVTGTVRLDTSVFNVKTLSALE